MTDDLVKRLNDFAASTKRRIENGFMPYIASGASNVVDMASESAARITALEAENARLASDVKTRYMQIEILQNDLRRAAAAMEG